MENRFRALLSKLMDPRHQRGQSIKKILKKELYLSENNFNIKTLFHYKSLHLISLIAIFLLYLESNNNSNKYADE
jgi:hypothetical protein